MNTSLHTRSNYDKFPATETEGRIWRGWEEIGVELVRCTDIERPLVVFDTYHGVCDEELTGALARIWPEAELIRTEELFRDEREIRSMTDPYVTDDELFGYLTPLGLADFFDPERLNEARERIRHRERRTIVYGSGAGYVAPNADLTLYADMARWEIQRRFRARAIHGLGVDNSAESPARQYKRGYFNDWPVLDNHKKSLYNRVDYWIDTHRPGRPLMIAAETFMQGIGRTVRRPFRVVPFFDPAPWGGQWMKEVCDLDRRQANFGWCFDCVPEENSLLLRVDGELFEMPAQNLIYLRAQELLGAADRRRFGESFPIRFDFLDTIGGGNLSLQVHPTDEYIRRTFGMRYTQDESYYLLDAEPGACVYLGVKRGVDPEEMLAALRTARRGGAAFDAERFVNRFPARRHDHYLIPGGTVTAREPAPWSLRSVLRPISSLSKCGTGAAWGSTANPARSISATQPASSTGRATRTRYSAATATASNRSPRARAGARSAPDCTKPNSSKPAVTGSPVSRPTRCRAASRCSTWSKATPPSSRALRERSNPSRCTTPRPSSFPLRSAATRSGRSFRVRSAVRSRLMYDTDNN